MNKEEIEKAKEDLSFMNEGDYITREMSNSKDVLIKYIQHLEQKESILDKVTDKLSKMKQSIEKLKNRDGESILMVDVCIQNIIAFYDDIEKIF